MRYRRMLGYRTLVTLLVCRVRTPAAGRKGFHHRMFGGGSFQLPLSPWRQRLIGSQVAGPERVPAHGRQLLGSEDTGQWRCRTEGDVGVPVIVVGKKVLVGIDHHDLRQLRQHRVDRVDVQWPEVLRKPALLLRGQRLAAEQQDLVFHQQFTQAIDSRLRQFIGEADALHHGAQGGGNARNIEADGARLLRWPMLGDSHAASITRGCTRWSPTGRCGPQPCSMFINASILTAAKLVNVSATAYGTMMQSLCRMAPQV